MKLGVLGSDTRMAAVASAAARAGDTIVVAGEPPGGIPWTGLLDPEVCDAILVGADGWDAVRGDAVRTLVQAGRTLLLAQPLDLSMLWAYELDMIARDSGAVLVPLLPDRQHPFIARLKAAIEASAAGAAPLGELESLRLERRLRARTREAVLAALSRDVDIIRVLVGEPARLGTLGAGDPDSAWPTLAVGFTGPHQLPVRWEVAPGEPCLVITLRAAGGCLEVVAPDEGDWTWTGPPPAVSGFDRAGIVLDRLRRGREDQSAPAATAIPPANWADAARAIELVETVPRSLARGRAIDLHQEEFSELGTFRGTMASVGCGLVLMALMVLLGATLVGGIASELDWEFGKAVTGAWPGIVLAVLMAFLALQLLPLAIGGRSPAPGLPPGRERGSATAASDRPS